MKSHLSIAVGVTLLVLGCEEEVTESESEAEELAQVDETPPGAAEGTEQGTADTEPIDDRQLAIAVQRELRLDDAVPAHRLAVDVNEGIATLEGTVGNLLAAREAERRAELVKGVRAVVDQIEVDPIDRPDAEVRRDVEAALLDHPATENYELEVSVLGGLVTLDGDVESWAEKDLAERVAAGVRGVTAVTNDVDIVYPTERMDQEIEQDLVARLRNDDLVGDALLEVNVADGRVTLDGVVGSAAERRRAVADAWVLGVESVDAEEVDVEWWARERMLRTADQAEPMTDTEIADAVKDAWLYDPRILSTEAEVQVEDGVATLTGTVNSVDAILAATADARNTAGVWRVRNLLRVDLDRVANDAVIAERVRESLTRSPYINRHEVQVTVLDGEVHLYGTVDNDFEREEATDVASTVRGALEVSNHLAVRREWLPVADWALEQDVESQIAWDPFVSLPNVTVEVEDGVAILTGVVRDQAAYDAAVRSAYEAGARRVMPDLAVEGGPSYLAPSAAGTGQEG